jgi:hypothetical protein
MLLSSELFLRDAVLELSERAAELAPQSFNSDAYTCEVVFSSGAGVERSDRLGRFTEVLSMERDAVDLSQFIGAPVLDGHQPQFRPRRLRHGFRRSHRKWPRPRHGATEPGR